MRWHGPSARSATAHAAAAAAATSGRSTAESLREVLLAELEAQVVESLEECLAEPLGPVEALVVADGAVGAAEAARLCAVGRHRRATQQRSVYSRRGTDGMSFLGVIHETPVIDAIYQQIVEDGRLLAAARTDELTAAEAAGAESSTPALTEADPGADACRADAFAARVLGVVAADGAVTWDRAASTVVTVEVVVDADTLRSMADHVALVNGQAVPGAVGRDLAAHAAWMRRIVVAPVTGHLLDYGTRVYIPDKLRTFALARDGDCRSPSCTRRAARLLQLDHAVEFPFGPSSAANVGALCRECHQRKTAGLLDITDSRSDGSSTVTTAWGQTVRVPPRSYLPATADPAAPTTEVDHEPPPF